MVIDKASLKVLAAPISPEPTSGKPIKEFAVPTCWPFPWFCLIFYIPLLVMIFYWNYRGVIRHRFATILKGYCDVYNSQIFILLEAMVSATKTDEIVQSWRFWFCNRNEVEGYLGRIWILWSNP